MTLGFAWLGVGLVYGLILLRVARFLPVIAEHAIPSEV